MSKLFNSNNLFMQTVDRFFTFCMLNVLTVACCLPIVTGGAALAACHKAMQEMLTDPEANAGKVYFQAFKKCFKQATVVWLINLLIFAFVFLDIVLLHYNFSGPMTIVTYIVLAIVGVLTLGVDAFIFPMICRYEDTLKNHLSNAFYLAIHNLLRTIPLVILSLCPLLIAVCSPDFFFKTVVLWIFIGISCIVFLQTRLVLPVLLKIEEADSEDTQE